MDMQHSTPISSPEPTSLGQRTVSTLDIDIADAGKRTHSESLVGGVGGAIRRRVATTMIAAFVACSLAVGVHWLWSGSAETRHSNWEHVSAATSASEDQGRMVLLNLDRESNSRLVPAFQLTSKDIDHETTRKARVAARRRDPIAFAKTLRNALIVPAASSAISLPNLLPESGLMAVAKDAETQFFQLHVSDCCDEDGDVVEVVVNGTSFATIGIMNAEVALSVPLSPGTNTVTLRGVRDGQGGITVKLRTSRGDFYCGRMREGQEYVMEVVTP